MTRNMVALLAFWVLPASAFAQGDFGLDLSESEEKKEEAPAESSPGEVEAAPSSNEPLSATPAQPATPGAPTKDPSPQQGERNIIQDDRVKSVQRKVYLKKGRFELSPAFGISINDPYYQKWSFTGRGAYYLADTLAIAVRGGLVKMGSTADEEVAKLKFQSNIRFSNPKWLAMGDVEWSPIYGKFTIFNSILHFDGYVLGGAGLVNTETSQDEDKNLGLLPAFDLGAGLRFVAKDFVAVNVAVTNTSYVDQPRGTSNGTTQNLMMLHTGLSLFFPFKSTGRESE